MAKGGTKHAGWRSNRIGRTGPSNRGTVTTMTDLELVLHPDSRLRRRARILSHVGTEERRLLDTMLNAMRRFNCVGLAAPQIGIEVRAITAEYEGRLLGLANPVLLDQAGSDAMLEGCLSIPGREVEVSRATSVWVQAVDTDDRTVQLKLNGFMARIVQHEVDHLNGVLIIDYSGTTPSVSADTEHPQA